MKKDRWLFLLALAVVAAQSAVRLAVVPLWNHYDETTHYEMLRFIVEHGRLPKPTDDSSDILARTGLTVCPLGAAPNETRCIAQGLQFGEMPGYYLLEALGQWLFRPANAASQVQLARFMSSLLAIAVAVLAWWTSKTLFPGQSLMAASTAALLGVIAGYSDLMTALSNDVGAVAALSFMVAVSVSLIKSGFSLKRILLLLVATVCCLLAKSTDFIALPLAALSVILVLWPRLSSWLRVGTIAAGIALVVLGLDWHLPAHWQVDGNVAQLARLPEPTAPLGQEVFQAKDSAGGKAAFWQALRPEVVQEIRGQVVTVGAWVRASNTVRVNLPDLAEDAPENSQLQQEVGPDWKFVAHTLRVPADWPNITFWLPGAKGTSLEFDGAVVVLGEMPSDTVPQYADASGRTGTWNGQSFVNLIDNGSAEEAWLVVRPQINRFFPWGGINPRLLSIYDWPRTGAVYWPALRWQFVTFWSGFGGGHWGLPVPGLIPYVVFTAVALTGLVYGGLRMWRAGGWAGWQWRGLMFLGAVVVAALLMSVIRIDAVGPNGNSFYTPTGRYFYVAILPTCLLLMWGWLAWWPRKWQGYASVAGLLVMYGLGVWSLVNIQLPYFQGTFHF